MVRKYSLALILALTILSLSVIPAGTDAQFIQNGFDRASSIGGTDIGTTDVRDVVINIINILLTFLGIIAILVIMFGVAISAAAAGERDRMAAGRRAIIAGAVGLTIILASFAIARFIVISLAQSTGGSLTF